MGIGAAVLIIAILAALPAFGFRAMFRDFGAEDDLPALTRVALFQPFPLLALPSIAALGMTLPTRQSPARRRRWTVAAIALALLGIPVYLVAMYLPIFALAAKIKAG